MDDREQLERAIEAQEQLRGVVEDEIVDLTVSSLRARLSALSSAGQRRRQATVLFTDLQGFTSLAEAMDPEVVSNLLNEVWSRLDHVVTSFGGLIDKHIGDAVMALWGAESSNENDPEQAVRAGLELQRAVAELNVATGQSLVLRVGICTGTVVFGEVATTREFTAMGDTVNVASRLEHLAPGNGVLIAHETYRHVRGVFVVSPLDPLMVKGRTKPVRAYVVHRPKPRTFRMPTRGIEGVETRMVGRDDELAMLCARFDDATRQRGLRTVAVVGEPGVGKSRLLYEFENWVELLSQEVYYLKARALATRQNVPYGVFRDLIASRFAILDSDTPQAVVTKLRDGFAPHLDSDEADLVGHWLGFDLSTSEAARQLQGSSGFSSVCAAHLAHFLRSLAQDDLVLMVVEDLHWADADSLGLLDHLTERLTDSGILFVVATRPTLLDERPSVLSGDAPCELVQLSPLQDHTSRALIADVLQHASPVPEFLVELITRRADGNPFFVEELIKMLIDDDVIIPGEADTAWRIDLDQFEASSVPSTLTGVLEARLDSLTTMPREALQRAAVVGRVFWDAAVSSMEPTWQTIDTAEALHEVCERELIYKREQSSLASAGEFIFKHALLRDVTYETVLLRDRQRLHTLAATWLSRHAGERLNEFQEMIADHRRLAGDTVGAAEIYGAAGRRALESGRSASARRLLEVAVDLWTEASVAATAEALLALAQACLQTGDINAADAYIAPLLEMALTDEQRAWTLYFASWVAADRADYEGERALLAAGLPLAESVGGRSLVRTLVGSVWSHLNAREFDKAHASAERGLAAASALGDPIEEGRMLMAVATVARFTGEYEESERRLRDALGIATEVGDLELENSARGNLGVIHHLIGDSSGSIDAYEAAEVCYLANLQMSIRLGMRHQQIQCHANLAQLYLRLDRPTETGPHLDIALRDALEFGRTADLGLCLIIEADRRLQSGDLDGALVLLGALQVDPRAGENDYQEIDHFLERAHLDHELVDRGMQRGHGRDIVELCRDILHDHTGDEQPAPIH